MTLLSRKQKFARKKILALHGAGSTNSVSMIQLQNLELSQPIYDIVYLNGTIRVEKPGAGLENIEEALNGPWYSWLPSNADDKVLLNAICEAVQSVLSIIESDGPFDGIYGFSQGGLIASLVLGLPQDLVLQSALQARNTKEIPLSLLTDTHFHTAIIACAAAPLSLTKLRHRSGLGDSTSSFSHTQMVHLIGRKDNYKSWSEALALTMDSNTTFVHYLDEGHEINRQLRNETEVNNLIRDCFNDSHVHHNNLDSALVKSPWVQTSNISSRSIADNYQVAAVKINTQGLSDTIINALAKQPANTPLLRLARERDSEISTTYGQMLSFCQPEGEGDLRRLGVQAGEVVAYLAPPGGNAVAAAAFLSISSQTCAAPVSASMSENDALLALEQYDVKHMILFDDTPSKGVRAAFEHYASSGNAQLHHATQNTSHSPGLFTYQSTMNDFQNLPVLTNPSTENGLLLRTSGTTSIPKIVPLRQCDLIINAAILADSIGITSSDVTYSVMPLDHIGGISASILCTVAAGASVTCDDIYNPQGMLDALFLSNPKPTWYSAVPTIHNATVRYLQDNSQQYLDQDGVYHGHNLRMIRSGAAALKEPDRSKLESIFSCDVVTTYSMSELMPISQPPKPDTVWHQKPGSVGVPIAASMAVVDPVNLRPLPFGNEGEIAISGSTVFAGYMDNPDANMQSRFLLKSHKDDKFQSWFLTGDLGEMDADGTLSLRGRIKELIKRGGEQIAPAEIEDILTKHPSINTAVCFSVPSPIYGEEVGCALVLESSLSKRDNQPSLIKDLREFLRQEGLASYKFPSAWELVELEDLPRTASRKLIRNGLADILGTSIDDVTNSSQSTTSSCNKQSTFSTNQQPESEIEPVNFHSMPKSDSIEFQDKPKVDWGSIAGLQFILACYVMFMHIGSSESWGAVSNLRQFPWHVHAFFALAGFSLAIIMPALINRKISFISARILGMYPLYGLAIILALGNLLVSCQPSTFSSIFNWSPLFSSSDQMFCQGTPLVQDSWLANVLLTIGIHLAGLQATPLWGATWFLGFYLWFISMYFQCMIIFPFIYNTLYKNRGNTRRLLLFTFLGLLANIIILLGFWYGYAIDATGYGLFDPITGLRSIPTPSQVEIASHDNAVVLGFYLFAPFWMVYFIAGMCAAFVYDAIRPSEQRRAEIWGYVADAITVLIIAISVAHVAQGYSSYGPHVTEVSLDQFFMRPDAANSHADPSIVNRIWDNIAGRLFAPITLLWIFALSTGQGLTAKILRFNSLSKILAPTAYACFLFHQIIGQWYYAATRNGEWWNWWNDQKTFYWFSPQPLPVEWYEYFYIVGLVVLFAKVLRPIEPTLRNGFHFIVKSFKDFLGTDKSDTTTKDTLTSILLIVERITGMEAKPEWSLEGCGLASLGVVQFVNTLETEFSTLTHKISLPIADIMSAQSIHDIASIVDTASSSALNTSNYEVHTQ